MLQIENPGDFGTSCLLPGPPPGPGRPGQQPTAAGLRVYPPNQFVSTIVPCSFFACAHAGPVWIGVGPIIPGGRVVDTEFAAEDVPGRRVHYFPGHREVDGGIADRQSTEVQHGR